MRREEEGDECTEEIRRHRGRRKQNKNRKEKKWKKKSKNCRGKGKEEHTKRKSKREVWGQATREGGDAICTQGALWY